MEKFALCFQDLEDPFPDEFTNIVGPLRDRMVRRSGKQSDEGRAVDSLSEIRVRASPSWEKRTVHLMFWFILDDNAEKPEEIDWSEILRDWLGLVEREGPFQDIEGVFIKLEDMSVQEYVESDRLDLDHLSNARYEKPDTAFEIV